VIGAVLSLLGAIDAMMMEREREIERDRDRETERDRAEFSEVL
jgi:hypothetical protein